MLWGTGDPYGVSRGRSVDEDGQPDLYCRFGAGLSEALNFGQNAGLDMDKVLGVVSGGAAQSWQMENRGSTMVRDEFDFGFAVDWMRKDLRICLAEAAANRSQLPVTALVAQFYAALSERGCGRNDTSSLIRLLRNGT